MPSSLHGIPSTDSEETIPEEEDSSCSNHVNNLSALVPKAPSEREARLTVFRLDCLSAGWVTYMSSCQRECIESQ